MKLLIGLGNPGAEHARNRHNAGFMALDAISSQNGFGPWRNKFQGQVAEGHLDGVKCLLLKPSTYMNESGRAAAEAMRFYKLTLDDVIVLHDEIDLAPGKVRVKTGGGVAGHNGLRSLTRHIGNDYARVRIGIGHPGDKSKVHSHVLKDFSRAELEWAEPLIAAIASAAPKLAGGDAANFMNAVARATGAGDRQPEPPRKKVKPRTPPSQRDLAKGAASRASRPDKAEEPDEAGPFARLRRLFGAGSGRS